MSPRANASYERFTISTDAHLHSLEPHAVRDARVGQRATGACSTVARSLHAAGRPARRQTHRDAAADEVLYVLDGLGARRRSAAETHRAPARHGASSSARGTAWTAEGDGRAVSVLVHDPRSRRRTHAVHRPDRGRRRARHRRAAVPARRDARSRLRSVTQFIGLVPPGRAPDHFHTVRRGDLRARGRGRAAHRRREEQRSARARACICRPGSSIASRTRARPSCACSASFAPPARRPRPITQTARPPSSPRRSKCHASSAPPSSSGKGTSPEEAGRLPPVAARSRRCRSRSPAVSATRTARRAPRSCSPSAHGGCLTMSLATELTQAGTPPGRIESTCRIVMDEVPGEGHQIVGSQVTMRATAEGADRTRDRRRPRACRRGLPVLDAPAQGRRRGDDQPRLTSGRRAPLVGVMPIDRQCSQAVPAQTSMAPQPRLTERVDELADVLQVECLPRHCHAPDPIAWRL